MENHGHVYLSVQGCRGTSLSQLFVNTFPSTYLKRVTQVLSILHEFSETKAEQADDSAAYRLSQRCGIV